MRVRVPSSPTKYGPVVQMVRAPACHAGSCQFKSDQDRQINTINDAVDVSYFESEIIRDVGVRISLPYSSWMRYGGIGRRITQKLNSLQFSR